MRGWRAQITGDPELLKGLVKQLAHTEYPLFEEADGIYLDLRKMPYESEFAEVRVKAREVLATLNSLIAWLAPAAELTLGSLDRVREDGKKEIFLSAEFVVSCTMTGSLTALREDGTEVEPPSPYEKIGDLMSLANGNGAVRDVINLWDRPKQDWVNLFRIFEIIQHETNGKLHLLGVSKNQLKLFERTANSRSAIGDHARHGVERYDPPDKPMDFDAAYALIRTLTQLWIISLRQTH